MRVIAHLVLLLGAAGLVVLAFLWPAAAASVEVVRTATIGDWGIGGRQLGLLWRGVWVATLAAALAQLLGGGLALGLARPGWRRRLCTWVGLIVLLTPPYLYAYAWSLPLLPEGIAVTTRRAAAWPEWVTREGRAIWCLAAWIAPVCGALLHWGWRASGRHAFALALVDARPVRAFRTAGLRAMVPWLAVSFLVALLLAITEYSVCHLCLVQTWNTEVLVETLALDRPGTALMLAWPLLALVGLVLLALWTLRRRSEALLLDLADLASAARETGTARLRAGWGTLFIVASVSLLLLTPWLLLIAYSGAVRAFVDVWRTYPREYSAGALCATGSAVAAGWIAVATDFVLALPYGRWRAVARPAGWVVIALATFGAVSPPALVGDAFLAAYVRYGVVSDHWPIVSLVTAARFAIIPILALRLASRVADANLTPLAATDGAGWLRSYFRVRLPGCWRGLLVALLAVWLLSFTEIAASSMVLPPGLAHLGITLLNQIHFGRDDQIVAMSLYLMAAIAVGVALAQWTLALPSLRAARRGFPTQP